MAQSTSGAMSGSGLLSALRNMKIWTFVGTADAVVKPQPTIDFMKQLTRSNSKAAITKFDGAEHTDVPALAYLSDEIDLIHWLIEK